MDGTVSAVCLYTDGGVSYGGCTGTNGSRPALMVRPD